MRCFVGCVAGVAAMLALGHVGGRAARKVGQIQGEEGVQGRQRGVPGSRTTRRRRTCTRRRSSRRPEPAASAVLLPRQQLRQPVQAEQEGRAGQRRAAEKAVENYQKAAEKLSASADPEDKKLGKLSLEYLVAAYGADKLNDPAKAEPVVQKMIQLEPSEPTNYFALAKIYEDAGAYDEAEQMLHRGQGRQAERPGGLHAARRLLQPPGHSTRRSRRSRSARPRSRTTPRRSTRSPTYYWDEAYRDFRLNEAEKKDVRRQGHRGGRQGAADQARLHGGAGLQGPAAPPAGEPREGPGQAAGAAEGSGRAQRQGERAAQAEGGRHRANRDVRAVALRTRLDPKAVRRRPGGLFLSHGRHSRRR